MGIMETTGRCVFSKLLSSFGKKIGDILLDRSRNGSADFHSMVLMFHTSDRRLRRRSKGLWLKGLGELSHLLLMKFADRLQDILE